NRLGRGRDWLHGLRRSRSRRGTIVFRANVKEYRDRNHKDQSDRAQDRIEHQPRRNGSDFLDCLLRDLPRLNFWFLVFSRVDLRYRARRLRGLRNRWRRKDGFLEWRHLGQVRETRAG